MELSLAIVMFAGSLALGSVGSTATLAALYTGFLIGVSGCICIVWLVNVVSYMVRGAKLERGNR